MDGEPSSCGLLRSPRCAMAASESHVAAVRGEAAARMAAPRDGARRQMARHVLSMLLVLFTAPHSRAFELTREEAALCAHRRPVARSSCVLSEWRRCLDANLTAPGACRGAVTSCAATNPRWAWATLVNGNSANYTSMALVQVLSARMFSCYKHITLVTPEVNRDVRSLLAAAGSIVREVERVVWAKEPPGVIDNYRWLMTKLQLWRPNVTGHDRVAFIDADIFLLSPRADGLFDQCSDPRANLQRKRPA